MREMLDAIYHKWDLVILDRLRTGPLRYMELLRHIRERGFDITEGVYNKTLKRLMAKGVIEKVPLGKRNHQYDLTPRWRVVFERLAEINALQSLEPDAGESRDEDAVDDRGDGTGRGISP
jgi:DNA-binding HxlR family transcriptional regulator